MPAFAQRNAFQFGVGLFKVRNRRNEPRVEAAHGDSVFQTGAHGVAGKAFGVADDYTAYVRTEGRFQRIRFRTGGTAAGGRIRFMGDKYELLGNVGAVKSVFLFGGGDEAVHYLGHMADIQAGYVETAVGNFRRQQSGKRFHAAFGDFRFVFHDKGHSTHTHNHTVAAAVKRKGGFSNVGFRRSGAGGQEGRQNPFGHVVVGNVVGADDDDAFAAAEFNPVLRHGNGLGGGSARGAHRSRRSAGADPLAKMRVGDNNGF